MLMFGEGTFTILHRDELEKGVACAEEFIDKHAGERKPSLFFSNIAKGGVGIVSED